MDVVRVAILVLDVLGNNTPCVTMNCVGQDPRHTNGPDVLEVDECFHTVNRFRDVSALNDAHILERRHPNRQTLERFGLCSCGYTVA